MPDSSTVDRAEAEDPRLSNSNNRGFWPVKFVLPPKWMLHSVDLEPPEMCI